MRKLNFVKALLIAVIALLGGGKTVAQTVEYVETDINNLSTGDVVVIVDKTSSYALPNTKVSEKPKATQLTLNDKKTKISSFGKIEPTSLEWVVTVTVTDNKGTRNYSFKDSNSTYYLLCKNDNAGVLVGATSKSTGNVYIWDADNKKLKNTKYERWIGCYKKQDWRCYKSGTETNIKETVTAFYKKITSDKKPAGIAYEKTSYTVNVGESFTTPKLNNPNELTPISYSIDCAPKGVATIDEKNGEVTLAGIEGTAIVTAKTDPTDTYAAGFATCTIEVIDPTNVYELVTDESVLKAGDKIIITNGKSGDVYAMKPWVFDENNCKQETESITIGVDGKITSPSSTIAKITLGGTAGAWTLYDGTYYLYAASSSDNHLKGRAELGTDKNDKATIRIGETNNNAIITFTGENTHNLIRYNSSSKLFSCYASGQAEIYIFRKAGDFSNTLTIGNDKFATFYSADAYIMPEGVTGGTITAADTQSGKLTINYTYTEGTIVPAKTALLLKGEPKTYNYAKTTSSATAPAENLLHGADAVDAEGKTYVEGKNVKYYILSHSTDATKKLGFYWAAADGAAISYQEPYAFLAIETAGSGAPIMLSIDGDDDTTAINGITNDTITDNTMYNLAGQRVNANAKGIIIINGKKVIKR